MVPAEWLQRDLVSPEMLNETEGNERTASTEQLAASHFQARASSANGSA